MFLKVNHELNCLQSAFSLKIRRVLILAIECLQNNNVAKNLRPRFWRLAALFRVPKTDAGPQGGDF